jgi:hypothetical protein
MKMVGEWNHQIQLNEYEKEVLRRLYKIEKEQSKINSILFDYHKLQEILKERENG